jgi:hypothetical protein
MSVQTTTTQSTEVPTSSLVKSVNPDGLSGVNLKNELCLTTLIDIVNFVIQDPELKDSKIVRKDQNGKLWVNLINFAKTDMETGDPIVDPYDNTHSTKLSLTTDQSQQFGDRTIGTMTDNKGKPITFSKAYVGSGQETGVVTFTEDDTIVLGGSVDSNEY